MTSHPPGYAEAAADVAGTAALPFMDRREFTMLVALVARRAASWSHDLMFTRNDLDEPATDDARQRFAADIRYATDRIAPARQDAQAPTPPPLPGASSESLDDGWFPSRCVICWKAITQYDTYGVSHPPGRRWHWDCVRTQAAHVGYAPPASPAAPAPSGARETQGDLAGMLRCAGAHPTHHMRLGDAGLPTLSLLSAAICRDAAAELESLTEARAEVARVLGELHDMTKRALAAERDCPTRHAAGFREGVEAAAKIAEDETVTAIASTHRHAIKLTAAAIRALASTPPAPAAAREMDEAKSNKSSNISQSDQ